MNMMREKEADIEIGKELSGQRISTKTITMIAVMTAVICVIAPISIPIGPVPISLGTLAIFFSIYVLGTKRAIMSCLDYLIIGFVGVPVFSGFTGGAAKLIGPTGGYLIGYVPMIIAAGMLIDKYDGKPLQSVMGMILGTLVLYAFGTAWFCYSADYELFPALTVCVFPFIIGDLLKIAAVAVLGPQVRKAVKKIG